MVIIFMLFKKKSQSILLCDFFAFKKKVTNLFQIFYSTSLNHRNVFLNPVFRPIPPLKFQ